MAISLGFNTKRRKWRYTRKFAGDRTDPQRSFQEIDTSNNNNSTAFYEGVSGEGERPSVGMIPRIKSTTPPVPGKSGEDLAALQEAYSKQSFIAFGGAVTD